MSDDRTSESEVQAQRPVMVLLDLLGRRWTLRVLWDLRDGPRSFGELQAGEISTSVLTQRLGELTEAGIVERRERRYALSARGEELGAILLPLSRWADAWRTAGAGGAPGG